MNWTGTPSEHLERYAEAFHFAAKKLVSDYGKSGALPDFEAIPIVFLYRHAFELFFKALCISGIKYLGENRIPQIPSNKLFTSHKLSDFIGHVKLIFEEKGWAISTFISSPCT